jgi:hypothetical protein
MRHMTPQSIQKIEFLRGQKGTPQNALPDYKYTQAEISQLLFKHEMAPANFIKEIRAQFKQGDR